MRVINILIGYLQTFSTETYSFKFLCNIHICFARNTSRINLRKNCENQRILSIILWPVIKQSTMKVLPCVSVLSEHLSRRPGCCMHITLKHLLTHTHRTQSRRPCWAARWAEPPSVSIWACSPLLAGFEEMFGLGRTPVIWIQSQLLAS